MAIDGWSASTGPLTTALGGGGKRRGAGISGVVGAGTAGTCTSVGSGVKGGMIAMASAIFAGTTSMAPVSSSGSDAASSSMPGKA